MNAKSILLALAACSAAFAFGETVDVPAGKTEVWPAGRTVADGKLVKTGAGTLDLTKAALKAEIDVREGAVSYSAGGCSAARARYFRFTVSESRPAPKEPPHYGGQGWQISEFRLTLGGKPVPYPKDAVAIPANAHREGPSKAIDGDPKTKCFGQYKGSLAVDLGEEIVFDGYTFDTANDAPGRDPRSWQFAVGMPLGGDVAWMEAGEVKDFTAPDKRFANVGGPFPVKMRDVVPPGCKVNLGANGRLVLKGAAELLENLSGCGVVELADSDVTILSDGGFRGAVCGKGKVDWR